MVKKRLFFLMLCSCLFGCTHQSIGYDSNNSSFTIHAQNDYYLQVYNNTLAMIETKQQMDTFKGDIELYNMDENKYLTSIHLKDGAWETGVINDGYYAIDLLEKKIYCYDSKGEKSVLKVNVDLSETWSFAMLSADCRYLVCGESKGCNVMLYDLDSDKKVRLCGFNGTWTPLYYVNDKFYIINAQEGELIYIDPQLKLISTLFANREMSYIAPYYSAYTTENSLVIYDVDKFQEKIISLSNEDETIVGGNKLGILTQSKDFLYYYNMATGIKSTFVKEESIRDVLMNNHQQTMVLTEGNHLFVLDENNAFKQGEIEYTVKRATGKHVINVPAINQNPKFPTGCESVSTVMLLNYLNKEIDVDTFIDHYLKTTKITEKDGQLYASNPKKAFVGDPRSAYSYGCMAPVIKEALVKYFGSSKNVLDTTGQSLENLCANYISKDQPVIIWATMGMIASYPSDTWITPEGDTYTWPSNEHCLLLVGYDDYNYYFNDPLTGRVTKYNRQLSERRYKELGMQSLTVISEQ